MKQMAAPIVSVIMGSESDWETMKHASQTLKGFDIDHECLIVSAHRTPARLADFVNTAERRGIEVIIAGPGCSAPSRDGSFAD